MKLFCILFVFSSVLLGAWGCRSIQTKNADGSRCHVQKVITDPWVDSSRCFHVHHDEHAILHPAHRFEKANSILQAWKDSMIGTSSFCCEDNPQEWMDSNSEENPCDQGWYNEWAQSAYFSAQITQSSKDLISLYLVVGKSRGGTYVWRLVQPLTADAATGQPFAPPEQLHTLDMGMLRESVRNEFEQLNLGSFSQNREDWFTDLNSFETKFNNSLYGNPFVVKNGEWHWLLNGAPDLCNAAQTVWPIPTGVSFHPS